MRAPRSLLPVVAVLPLLLVGCVEPLQNGGVTIVGDPSARLGALCRFRHGTDDGFCVNEAPELKPARARRMTGANDGLRGPFATGRAGDYMLENEEIAVVIARPGPDGGTPRGGALVDAADARTRIDALGQVLASFGGTENHAVYDEIKTGAVDDGSAYVEVEGHALATPTILVTTRYALAPGSRVVMITTTLLANGAGDIHGLDLGDTVTWGGAASSAPGAQTQGGDSVAPDAAGAPPRSVEGVAPDAAGAPPRSVEGVAPDAAGAPPRSVEGVAPYLFGVGHGAAYALVKDGSPFLFRSDTSSSVAVLERGVTLSPARPVEYTRMLLVAPRGDTAALATELVYLGGGP